MYEIERKFLLDALPPQVDDVEPTRIDQGYLSITDAVEIRIRARSDAHLLTIKQGRGEVRREVTVPLTREQFDQLWELTEGKRICKRRWVLSLDPQVDVEVEVDQFDGPLDGLLIAEVEFDSQDASRAFEPPAWFGLEVTDDHRYRNAALAGGMPTD